MAKAGDTGHGGPGGCGRLDLRAQRVVAGAFFALAALVLILIVLLNDGASYGADPGQTSSNFPLPSWASVALGGALCLALGALLAAMLRRRRRRRAPFTQREFLWVTLALAALVFVAQVVLVRCIYAVPGWDAGTILEYARWKASGLSAQAFWGENVNEWVVGYLDLYPNNALLTWVLTGCYALGTLCGVDGLYLACLLGALCVNVAGTLVCLLVGRLTSSHAAAWATLALFTLLFSLSPWIAVPYSDTFATLFVALVLWLGAGLLEALPADAAEPRAGVACVRHGVRWLVLGAVTLLGYLIKPTVLIAGAAVALVACVRLAGCARLRLRLLGAGVLGGILAAGLVLGGVSPLVRGAMGAGQDAAEALGMAHFFMMGQNDETTGSYLQSDVDFSRAIEDPAERTQMEVAGALERIAARGVVGNLAFYANKLLFSFADGTFLWAGEAGESFFQTILPEWGPLSHALRALFYREGWQEGADRGVFQACAQIAWCAVLALAALGGARTLRRPSHPAALVAMVALLGLFAYLMLFECRARYLFCFGPAMLLCAAVGLDALGRWLAGRTFGARSGCVSIA